MEGTQRPTASSLVDREGRAIAELLTRFKNLIQLAAMPKDGAILEQAAAQSLQIETESQALVRATEDLLKLTREMKELWLFGPIRGIGEKEIEGKMDEDSKKVGAEVHELIAEKMDEFMDDERKSKKSKKKN